VEVNATILGAFHHLSPAIVVSFSAYPLSAVLQYIFIILFTFIDLFHKVHSHHTFTFLSLPQFLASPVIFTNWGKQGVTNRNNNYFESHTQRGYSRIPSETQRRSYNRFESLSTEVECYKCNNFGHMAKNCRMTVPPKEPQQSHKQEPQKMTWIRKQDQYSNEECTVALQAKQKKRGWYVDSGCSKHMTGDRDKFLTL
jgi:hypothetical protein